MSIKSEGPSPVNVRRLSFAVGSFSLLMIIFIVAAPYWRVTAMWGSAAVIANIYSFEGLFLSCVRTMGTTGTNQCLQMPSYGYRNGMGYPGMPMYTQGVYCKYNYQ